MKKLCVLALVALLALSVTNVDAARTLKVGHGLPTTHPLHKGAEKFAELVSERTHGEVTVEVFPALQLGSVREMFEDLSLGTLDIAIVTTDTPAFLGLKYWRLLESGYMYQSYEHAKKFFESPLMQELSDELEKMHRITVVDPSWYYGIRHLTTANTPVKTPEDLKGLKIRVPEAPGYLNTLKGMGANVTPVAFGELYMALKTGVVDGQENPFATIYSYKFYEAQKYLNLTGHLISHNTAFMSTDTLESFDEATQQIIRDSISEASDYNDQLIIDSEQDYLNKLQEVGMTVVEADAEAFRTKAVKYLQEEWYTPEEVEFHKKIQELQ